MAKRRRRRKIKVFNLILVVIMTLTFVGAILLATEALYNSFFAHDYTVNPKDDLLDLPLNIINNDYLEGEDFKYYEDNEYTSKLGIDVSSHQGEINWDKVKKQGIEFVYIRVGYRGYQGGSLYKDTYFMRNYEEAKRVGLDVGVYFFSQATTLKEAVDEAYFTYEIIKDLDIDLHVVYDLEDIDYDKSRIEDLDLDTKTSNAMAFASKVVDFGYEPMIYTNLEWTKYHYDLAQIYNYPIWYAQYNDEPTFDYYFNIWQYSDEVILEGINVPVDMNLMLIKK